MVQLEVSRGERSDHDRALRRRLREKRSGQFSNFGYRQHQPWDLNLLPIPILDGGHLVYFALEA